MDLGLALTAGNAFFKEQQSQDIRDREAKRFDWERQRADAEMGLLPDRVAADRSGFQLRAGQNQQGMELLPGDTTNKRTAQDIQGRRLTGEAGRVDAEEATKDTNAQLGLNQSANNLMMQDDKLEQERNVQRIATETSKVDVAELPRMLAQKKLSNEISAADADIMVAAKLSDLIDAGDTNSIVRLLNAQKATIADPKIAGLPDVASVAKAMDANGQEFLVLKDAQGNQIMARPIDAYRAAKNSMGKVSYEKLNEGDSLYRVQGGRSNLVATAPTSPQSSKRTAMDRDLETLQKQYGMTKEQALGYMRQGKTPGREAFILENYIVAQKEGRRNITEADFERWGNDFDRAQKKPAAPTPAPAGSNSGGNPTMAKPEVRSVLGLD